MGTREYPSLPVVGVGGVVVVDALGLEVDESLLTGEADPVDKAVGDMVQMK